MAPYMWNHQDMHLPVVEENILLLSLAISPFFRGLDVSINAYVPEKNQTGKLNTCLTQGTFSV